MLEKSAPNRVEVSVPDLPKYNKKVAAHYLDPEVKSKKNQPNLLEDSRFKSMFEDADFIVDEAADEYKLVRPVLARLTNQTKKLEKGSRAEIPTYGAVAESPRRDEGASDDELLNLDNDDVEDSSTDDERMTKALKRQHKIMKKERKRAETIGGEELNKDRSKGDSNLGSSLRRIDMDDRLNVTSESRLHKKLIR